MASGRPIFALIATWRKKFVKKKKRMWHFCSSTLKLSSFQTCMHFKKFCLKVNLWKKGIECITFSFFFFKKRYMPEKYTHHALKSLQNASWPLTITDFGLEAVEVVGVIQSSNSCVVSNHWRGGYLLDSNFQHFPMIKQKKSTIWVRNTFFYSFGFRNPSNGKIQIGLLTL